MPCICLFIVNTSCSLCSRFLLIFSLQEQQTKHTEAASICSEFSVDELPIHPSSLEPNIKMAILNPFSSLYNQTEKMAIPNRVVGDTLNHPNSSLKCFANRSAALAAVGWLVGPIRSNTESAATFETNTMVRSLTLQQTLVTMVVHFVRIATADT
jgi:hypothetical protein